MKTTFLLPILIFLVSFVQAQKHIIPKNAIYVDEILEPTKSEKEAHYYTLSNNDKKFPKKVTYYFLNGNVYSEMYVNENNDLTTGKSIWYFEDGSLQRINENIDEGNFTISYYKGENILYSKTYYKDYNDGLTEIYYINGKKREQQVTNVSEEGELTMLKNYFDKNGKEIGYLKTTGTLDELLNDGIELFFDDETEEIIQKDVYKKGKLISSKKGNQ